MHGDHLGKAVQQLKRESGKGLFLGGVKLPLALAELELIDEYEFVVQPPSPEGMSRCASTKPRYFDNAFWSALTWEMRSQMRSRSASATA